MSPFFNHDDSENEKLQFRSNTHKNSVNLFTKNGYYIFKMQIFIRMRQP